MTKPNPNDSLDHDPLDASRLDNALDRGFAAAKDEPEEDRHPSVLKQIGARVGSRPSVSLRDVDSTGETPMLEPFSGKKTKLKDTGRYKVLGILGQGGVGAVHRGHDTDLGRDVAMKFLHDRYAKEPSVLHRFVEEAQIGGQLQHPGIVPVYELGLVDGKPFFTMKMVKGETLAKKLLERVDVATDRRKFLVIFEDICQTMAYAHARGVVHRDLKPANIMIGSFGEVQVVDWGMGKVLANEGEARESRQQEPAEVSVIETAKSSGRGTESIVGSVMGTPAYMPPEQARGDVDAMDERSDVFSLGAVLCEILTGQPPYVGNSRDLIGIAAMAQLEDAHARLAACGAEQDLLDLTTLCLMPAPAARPRSAGEVAKKVLKHLGAAEERVHEATIRALSLKRMQKFGIALTAVIAAGLAVSMWFGGEAADARVIAEEQSQSAETLRKKAEGSMNDAEASKAIVVQAAFHAQRDNRLEQVYLDKFKLLSYVRRLETAKQARLRIYAARPGQEAAMRDWLAGDVTDLREALTTLGDVVAGFEAKALPQSEAERAANAQTHLRAAELHAKTLRLGALSAARAVRLEGAPVSSFEVAGESDDLDTVQAMAKKLSGESHSIIGREAEGLAFARRAVELAQLRQDSAGLASVRIAARIALAWSLFANGLDDQAIEQSEQSLAAAGESVNPEYEDSLVRLQRAVDYAKSPAAATEFQSLAADVAALQTEVSQRWHWKFATKEELFLHTTLRQLVADIKVFEATEVAQVRMLLSWAEQVEGLTAGSHEALWGQAALAISAGNGTTASKLYAAHQFLLKPQKGLVPIGMNPVSKLWEFYHLRSAWDGKSDPSVNPIEIPKHRQDGSIEVTAETGIVFVLLPGGTYTNGAQGTDATGLNYDPMSSLDYPPHPVSVEPFFMSRYEMTSAQWARMWTGNEGGRHPSYFHIGEVWNRQVVTATNPVEMTTWLMCDALMTREGLLIPSGDQWEYACRSGTTTPWSCDEAKLVETANFADQSAKRHRHPWGQTVEWDDGFVSHAPVGSFEPNAFGLHDIHGNVNEFTRTRAPNVRPGMVAYLKRGGYFRRHSVDGRSAAVVAVGPSQRDFGNGLRPARALDL